MIDGQTNIFEMLYPTFKIDKPIRLIELFAGYGSQALALKYLGVNFEHWKICEWAIKSIQAYKDIHMPNEYHPYGFMEESKGNLAQYLYDMGISSNYNNPMTLEQIKRLSLENLATICENIYVTNNLVNIQKVKGKDLEIVEPDKYCYIMTYSFPCQDLSLAGLGKGMSDTSTRSGMLWEVERILTECENKPQVLLMENVPQVHGEGNTEDFNKWQLRLEQIGYKNYWKDLIATDYEIPQTRNRTFMVSILGDYNYTFPKPKKLKLKLKDMLEDNVDEKYFLSEKMIKCFLRESDGDKFPRGDRFQQELKLTNERNLAATITTAAGTRATDNFITNKSLRETLKQNDIKDTCYIDTYNKRIDEEKSGTITTGVSFRNNTFLAIKNATKQGYLKAEDGDGVDISGRMEYHRGAVQKGMTQTLSTMGGENNGVVVGTYQFSKSDNFMQGKERLQLWKETSDTLQTTPKEGIVNSNLRIRKLTPRECFRLMGVKDDDFDKVRKNQSDASLYHLAGDSIVVNVLMAIFKEML